MYTIPTNIKTTASHGNEKFDRFYFGLFFRKFSQKELLYYHRFFHGWIRYLDTQLPLKRGQNKAVLEIGCGIGAFAKILYDRGLDVHATDISKFIISKAKSLQPHIKFSQLDIEKQPKDRTKYDFIFAFEVIEHLEDPLLALKNMFRLLKDNATLVLTTPLPTPLVLSDPMHKHVYKPEFWQDLAQTAGFKVSKCQVVSFLPFFYRFSQFFSWPLPISTTYSLVNTTCFLILRK